MKIKWEGAILLARDGGDVVFRTYRQSVVEPASEWYRWILGETSDPWKQNLTRWLLQTAVHWQPYKYMTSVINKEADCRPVVDSLLMSATGFSPGHHVTWYVSGWTKWSCAGLVSVKQTITVSDCYISAGTHISQNVSYRGENSNYRYTHLFAREDMIQYFYKSMFFW